MGKNQELQAWRKKLDRIDHKLVKLLFKRDEITKQIGKYKKTKNMPVQDKKREKEVIKNRKELAEKYGLDADYVEDIILKILEHSRNNQ